MSRHHDRRRLLIAAAGIGTGAALGDLGFLRHLQPVAAEEAAISPEHVRFRPEIEPLVRLLEDTSRERLLEGVAGKIRGGTTYRQLLAALLLAGVRNVRPHPVGFKFHAVLVVNSAHQASLASPEGDRWLPLFWALDNFKSAQAQDAREGDWTLPAVRNTSLPAATDAKQRLEQALDRWDESAGDAAAAQFVRSAGKEEVFELLWRYGARDFRDIGHKAIYVANAWRTLEVIGWEHAEPVVRSLAMALQERGGTKGNPAELDDPADRPWRGNLERVKKFGTNRNEARPDPKVVPELLTVLREGTPAAASDLVISLMQRGVAVSTIWDGVLGSAGELLMRKPGLVGIHCVTTANAMHYAAQASRKPETRLLVLLQAAAFMTMFRQSMGLRGTDGLLLDRLEPAQGAGTGAEAIEAIFADVPKDRASAARLTLAYLDAGGSPDALLTAARRLIFLKGENAHDYKFSSAALEDYRNVSKEWRNRYLATAMFNLRGAPERDNPLVQRTRAALGT